MFVPAVIAIAVAVFVAWMLIDGDVPTAVRNRAVLAAIAFALGVTTIFVGLGAAALGLYLYKRNQKSIDD